MAVAIIAFSPMRLESVIHLTVLALLLVAANLCIAHGLRRLP